MAIEENQIDFFILGSQSIDRKQLMEQARLTPFIVLPSDYAENDQASNPARLAEIFAKKKCVSVLSKFRNQIKQEDFIKTLPDDLSKKPTLQAVLITADTIVSFKSEVIGKASNDFEAFATLSKLEGQTHKLITAFHFMVLKIEIKPGLVDLIDEDFDHSITKVKFNPLTHDQIRGYILTDEWRGRAGCYAIQSVASQFVKSIEGSHSGVIGLPISDLVSMLENMGYIVMPRP